MTKGSTWTALRNPVFRKLWLAHGVSRFAGPVGRSEFWFALNAACFLLIVLAIWQWKQPAGHVKLRSESFFESFGTVVHYVRCAAGPRVCTGPQFLIGAWEGLKGPIAPGGELLVVNQHANQPSNGHLLPRPWSAECRKRQ